MGKKSRRQKSKEVNSSSNRNTLVVGVILIAVVGYWGINQLGGPGYPKLVSGVYYDAATVSADGKVSVPQEVMGANPGPGDVMCNILLVSLL